MAFGATATSAMTAIAKRRDRHRSIGDVLPFAAGRAEPRISAACDHQWPDGAWDAVRPRPRLAASVAGGRMGERRAGLDIPFDEPCHLRTRARRSQSSRKKSYYCIYM